MNISWYSVCSFLFVYFFFFVVQNQWQERMTTTSITVIVIFSKVAFWKPLDRSYVWSSFSTIYESPWQHHFERLLVVENVMDMDQHMCWIFHQDLSERHETEIDKGTWKKYQLHKSSSVHFEEHCTILDNLLAYWIIFTILKFMQCRYCFYKDG